MTAAPIELDFRLRPHGSMLEPVYRGSKVSVYMGGYTAVFVHDQITLKFDSGSIWDTPGDVAGLSDEVIIEQAYNMAAARFRPNHVDVVLKAIANARDLGFYQGRHSMAKAFQSLLDEAG